MLQTKKAGFSLPSLGGHLLARKDELDKPLVQIGDDALTTRSLTEGVAIAGGVGSGKTSASGKLIATSMLRAGWGGVVLCAKPDEAQRWVSYCEETGRSDSLVLIDGSLTHRFNFLEYELLRPNGGGQTFNLVQLFMTIAETKKRLEAGGDGGGGDQDFWRESGKLLLTFAFDVLIAATGTLRMADLSRFLDTLPREEAVWQNQEEAIKTNFALQIMKKALEDPAATRNRDDMEAALRYFRHKPLTWDSKVWGSIEATILSIIGPFLTGWLRNFACTHTTVVPDMAVEGAVIVLDLSIKRWKTQGLLAQVIFKHLYQQAIEARGEHEEPKPTFLFIDEAAFFLTQSDNEFVSTSRSARCANIYITQNIEAYIRAIGGAHAEATVDNFLSNFNLKIMHANSSVRTNKWASELVGRGIHLRGNSSEGTNWNRGRNWSIGRNWSVGRSTSHSTSLTDSESVSAGRSGGGNRGGSSSYNDSGPLATGHTSSAGWSWGWNKSRSKSRSLAQSSSVSQNESSGWNASYGRSQSHGGSSSHGVSEQMDLILEPNIFATQLRTGGPSWDGWVDAIAIKTGGWSNGQSFRLISFKQ